MTAPKGMSALSRSLRSLRQGQPRVLKRKAKKHRHECSPEERGPHIQTAQLVAIDPEDQNEISGTGLWRNQADEEPTGSVSTPISRTISPRSKATSAARIPPMTFMRRGTRSLHWPGAARQSGLVDYSHGELSFSKLDSDSIARAYARCPSANLHQDREDYGLSRGQSIYRRRLKGELLRARHAA